MSLGFRSSIISATLLTMVGGPATAFAQTPTYPSTTTITASSNNGDISGTINSSWDNTCVEFHNELPTYTTTIAGMGAEQGMNDPTDPSFDSALGFFNYFGPGSYLVVGNFSGFGGFVTDSGGNEPCDVAASSGSLTVVVPGPVASTVQLSAPGSIIKGQTAVITITVSANYYDVGPNPTGTAILFYGSTILASKSLTAIRVAFPNPISSAATFNLSTSGVPVGSYSITAVYNGDSNLSGSSSTPATVAITQPQPGPTTTALVVNPTTLTSGQAATLTATVTPTSGVTPTGTVSFFYGTLSLGTVTLSNGSGSLTESTRGLSGGVYAITAHYNGDSYNYASTSPAQNVTLQNITSTTLSANPTIVPSGQSVTFAATVTRAPGTGVPTGKVNFSFDGYTFASANLNAQGIATATFSTKNLSSGAYSITSAYAGDAIDVASTSAPVTITVQ